MKKMWKLAVVALAAVAFVACASSVEKKAKDIVERSAAATAAGNYEELARIAQEEQEYFSTLSAEEQAEYNKAALEAAQELLGK